MPSSHMISPVAVLSYAVTVVVGSMHADHYCGQWKLCTRQAETRDALHHAKHPQLAVTNTLKNLQFFAVAMSMYTGNARN